jgi:hypothetical protein
VFGGKAWCIVVVRCRAWCVVMLRYCGVVVLWCCGVTVYQMDLGLVLHRRYLRQSLWRAAP